jgi:hypothetical protein
MSSFGAEVGGEPPGSKVSDGISDGGSVSFLRKRLLPAAGAATAVSAALLYVAPPASATVTAEVTNYAAHGYADGVASMWFEADGDRFAVCDNWSDGAGAIGYWKVGRGGNVHDIKYSGGSSGADACNDDNTNVPEASYVYIKVCVRNNGNVVNGTCSEWDDGYTG